ncbi:hypothetical protein EOL96_01545 [Candidatus Saccharibacteria bacterium]|nr:hypothetical protein [Candidatus Saccharibacteria bacterium]
MVYMNKGELRSVAELLIPAVAYGDAAGLPVETLSFEEIRQRYGRIGRLLPSQENPFYESESNPGAWSDDTQLTIVIARSLTRVGAFNLSDIADLHVDTYNDTPKLMRNGQMIARGWGKSTAKSVERYMQGVPAETTGEAHGAGNGVLMKMSPLALWHVARDVNESVAYAECDMLTSFTHNNPIAKIATRVHHDSLQYLMTQEYIQEEFIHTIQASAANHERVFGCTNNDASDSLRYLGEYRYLTTDRILQSTDGRGFYAPQTLAMAYGTFLAHDGEFAPSVYEAVNLGGDTDSNASIVATMALMRSRGQFAKPNDFERVTRYDELAELSHRFAIRALVEAS